MKDTDTILFKHFYKQSGKITLTKLIKNPTYDCQNDLNILHGTDRGITDFAVMLTLDKHNLELFKNLLINQGFTGIDKADILEY